MSLFERNLNLLSIEAGVIAHQVSVYGVMGAGLAKDLAKLYPEVKDMLREGRNKGELQLGSAFIAPVSRGFYISNLVAQTGIRASYADRTVYTDYPSLVSALIETAEFVRYLGLPIYLPDHIGCGLANGDWHMVLRLIESVAEKYPGVDFTICKLG